MYVSMKCSSQNAALINDSLVRKMHLPMALSSQTAAIINGNF